MARLIRLLARVTAPIRDNSLSWLSYLYFLRFSLFLWLAPPLLVFLDAFNISTPITRVLFIVGDGWQAFHASASIVLLGWVAMLLARLVCVYGPRRFGIGVPKALTIYAGGMRLRVLFWSQLPGLFLLAYMLWLSLCDAGSILPSPLPNQLSAGATRFWILAGALGGMSTTAFVWFVIGWIYYLLHEFAPEGDEIWEFILPYRPGGDNPVSRLMRHVLGRAKEQVSPAKLTEPSRFLSLARLLGPGYLSENGEIPASGHSLAAVVAAGFLLLYFIVGYVSFPLPGTSRRVAAIHGLGSAARWLLSWSDYLNRAFARHLRFTLGHHTSGFCVGFAACVLAAFLLVLYLRARTNHAARGKLFLAGSFVFAAIWILIAREPRYPAIASILILLMLSTSLLGGLAFFFDRFRVPSLVILLVCLFLYKRVLPTDHIYPTLPAQPTQAKTPAQIAADFAHRRAEAGDEDDPMIVITATGGGLHSAYWTATVLDGIEEAFRSRDPDRPLKNRILLMSSASGGSIAVGNWIAQHDLYPARPVAGQPLLLHEAADHPAIEAIGWGLLHTDLWKMLFPWGGFLHDRAWFLEQANLARLYLFNHLPPNGQDENDQAIDEQWSVSKRIVSDLAPRFDSSGNPDLSNVPAFSLNATVVETGDRFLLANYQPKLAARIDPLGALPWQSALSFYSQYQDPRSARFRDLNLSTASRLSANFPYVSPVSRADVDTDCPPDSKKMCRTFHLADGGYYDNDGVASAVEFLWLAFGEGAANQGLTDPAKKQRVLLIQIRDYPLPSGTTETAAENEDRITKSDIVSQTLAPVLTVFNSWQAAQSTRNQRELGALKAALPNADLSAIAFAFPGNPESCCGPPEKPGTTTLNWRLSNADQLVIQNQWKLQEKCALDLADWTNSRDKNQQVTIAKNIGDDCDPAKQVAAK